MNTDDLATGQEAQKIDLFPVREGLQRLEKGNREDDNVKSIQEQRRQSIRGVSVLKNVERFDLKEQFHSALETREAYHLNNDDAPTLEQMQQWLTPEREAAIRKLSNPVSGLRRRSENFEQSIEAIDASGFVDDKTYVHDVFKYPRPNTFFIPNPSYENQKDCWQFWVMDGSREMGVASYDDTAKYLDDRIVAVQAYRARNGLIGFNRILSALLLMHALKTGNSVDQEYYTVLDEDEAYEKINVVPCSGWSEIGRGAGFFMVCGVHSISFARFRSSVGGNVAVTS